jgi:hypothetical protein
MAGANSVPVDFPLGSLLKYWKCFDHAKLKKEHFIYYCNEVWPQYQLGTKRWCENGSLDYDTILQLDWYCKNERDGQRYHTCKPLWPYIKPSVRGLPDPKKNLRKETWISLMILCHEEHLMSHKGNPHCLFLCS